MVCLTVENVITYDDNMEEGLYKSSGCTAQNCNSTPREAPVAEMPFGGISLAESSATNSVFGGGRLPSPKEPSTSNENLPQNVTSTWKRIAQHQSPHSVDSLETESEDESCQGNSPQEENSPQEDAKHKLKCKLKQKLGDIEPAKLFSSNPRPVEEPSESDEERKNRRRHQNKMAARRSRQRRKDVAEGATKEVQELECLNTSLKYEIKQLNKEREKLETMLRQHDCTLPR